MQRPNQYPSGVRRLIQVFLCSVRGLKVAIKYEIAFRQELILLVMTLFIAFLGSFSALQRLGLIVPVLLLLIVELLNSAIEAVVDRVGFEYHELAGRAKDLGSAAVMVTLILVITFWMAVFFSKWPVC